MKRARWGCCSVAFVLAVLLHAQVVHGAVSPSAAVYEPAHAQVLLDARDALPDDHGDWREVALPDPTHNGKALAVWLRFDFDAPAHAESWALYLPYLYGGGAVYLNRVQLASVPTTDTEHHVRWERPRVFPLPDTRVRAGPNTIHVRVVAAHPPNGLWLARPAVGPQDALDALADQRLLWMRTMPQITVGVCLLFALFVGFVWWSRRREVLYGLFGLAVALWGVRTLTFVVERLPAEHWWLWRIVYHGANGGFIVTMAIFAMRLAGVHRPLVERALFGYWLVGPLALLASGGRAESLVGRVWTLGMIPIGIAVVVFVALAWYRQRSWSAGALFAAVAIAVCAGIHDYLVAWHVAALDRVLPGWPGQRIFLMHYGANLVLLVMAGLLTTRFVRTLDEVEELNTTLERRVAARESELAENYQRLGALERERAAAEERQRIMRDLHDGLGSRLFTSLSRAERGSLRDGDVADTLRACIAEMRVALEALASDEADFTTALGNFLFRWEGPLREAGVRPVWSIDVADEAHRVAPHVALQILRILQEALTNVLKHARASEVRVEVNGTPRGLSIRVEDNGRGYGGDAAGAPARGSDASGIDAGGNNAAGGSAAGGSRRGMANMQARAKRMGASIDFGSEPGRTWLELRMPGDEASVSAEAKAEAASVA